MARNEKTPRLPLPGGAMEEARGAAVEVAAEAREGEARRGSPDADPDPAGGDEGTLGVADDDTVGTDEGADDRRFGAAGVRRRRSMCGIPYEKLHENSYTTLNDRGRVASVGTFR